MRNTLFSRTGVEKTLNLLTLSFNIHKVISDHFKLRILIVIELHVINNFAVSGVEFNTNARPL